MRYLTPFENFNRESRLLSNFFTDLDRDFWAPMLKTNRDGIVSPAIDVEEKDGVYFISVDMPGIKKEDIKIDLEGRTLSVSAERTRETKGDGKHFERIFGRVERSITLPTNIDAEKINAELKDGVLHVTLPRVEAQKLKKIEVKG